jgi:hypothetical protein
VADTEVLDRGRPVTGKHVLLPDMSFGCGETPITAGGGFEVGANARTWPNVTCPGCRKPGLEVLRLEQQRMQGMEP